MSMKNCSDTIGNQTHDLPACSTVPQSSDKASVNSEARISPSLAYRQCTAQSVKVSNRQLFMLHTELQFDDCAWHQFTWKYVVPVFVMYE